MKSLFKIICWVFLLFAHNVALASISESEYPRQAVNQLVAGHAVNVIVMYEHDAVEQSANMKKRADNKVFDDVIISEYKAAEYHAIKQAFHNSYPDKQLYVQQDYNHLPLALIRVQSYAALINLAAQKNIVGIYDNSTYHLSLAQSLPLIKQNYLASLGQTGDGATVAVLDTGANYTLSAFGACTAPGVPVSCKVIAAVDIAPDDGALDDNGHGTNTSGIVAGVAPGAHIAVLDVFDGTTTNSAYLISAINWVIANQAAYNIVALNMSLGDGTKNTSPCSNSRTNVMLTPINNLRAAGILPVAASGNEGYTNALSNPACTPGLVSVGAVYDSNIGNIAYATCSDGSTAADNVACFSNSASFLTMLAPGSVITAAGLTMAGTSQASPHVAGAAAIMRMAYPAETLDQTVARLTNGVSVLDARNSIAKPRLSLLQAVAAVNDAFASAPTLSGSSGQAEVVTVGASKEANEPDHAENMGGASVWWRWVAPMDGQLVIDTHGSDFDTLLAIYTGSGLGNLLAITSNDDDGTANGNSNVIFQVSAGTEYRVALDGKNGATGTAIINWVLNPNAKADVSVNANVTLNPVYHPGNIEYAIVVNNTGPDTATNINVLVDLVQNNQVVSIPPACQVNNGQVRCIISTLAMGQSQNLPLTIAPASAGLFTLNASVSNDVPDPVSTNNLATVDVTLVDSGGYIDADIPTLPEWALLLFIGCMITLGVRNRNNA